MNKPSVLIVDDESEIRSFLVLALDDEFACTTVASAEDALTYMREKEFELVISDISMPGMSGLKLIPRLKEISQNTVVVMISGIQTVESAVAATRQGAFDYLIKPFDSDEVVAVMKRALKHHKLIISRQHYKDQLEELIRQRTAALHRALGSLEKAYRSTLKALTAALEARDSETYGHSERVVAYSLRLGQEYGIDPTQMQSLEFGSLLHDIGKIGVPDSILRKPARLTEEEWVLMREHPLRGQEILSGIEFLRGATRVVAQHHEKWDGTGYPLGLRGEEIDLCARIFAVADAFDAITSERVYKRSQSYEAAARELNQLAGRQFDPRVVEAFRRVPPGDWQELAQRAAAFKETKAVSPKALSLAS